MPAFQDIALGTDLVFVPRLEKRLARHGEAFLAKLLTPEELADCRRTKREFSRRAAGKIAVKEAASKALGIGINGLGWSEGARWKEIEVIAESRQPPGIRLSGGALATAEALGIRAWKVSLSHDGDYAMASVIGLI